MEGGGGERRVKERGGMGKRGVEGGASKRRGMVRRGV